MRKIVIIGAGSWNFTRAISRDILSFPALADSHIVLVDIEQGEKNMNAVKKIIEKTIAQGSYPAKVDSTFDRREALKGADAVVITIRNDLTIDAWEPDISIPKKYGVDVNIGDTRGPSGIFRFLRSAPAFKAFAEDINELCPNALVLNYTNPMCMVTSYLRHLGTEATGLCHSVQGTAAMLAKWINADMKDVAYKCAGINHQAFYLEYKVKGEDAYPMFRKVLSDDPKAHMGEAVRIEMFKGLGYFVTESSGHNSEYNAWFRKRQDVIDKYIPNSYAASVRIITDRDSKRDSELQKVFEQEAIDLRRGNEYAASIINAVLGDGEMYEFNGNIPNTGLITNLPYGNIVEVPILASKNGLRPEYIGDLPRQIAALNTVNSQCEELAVEGCLTGNKDLIHYACVNDPLSAAVCSIEEIHNMVDEMFEANKEKLPMFN